MRHRTVVVVAAFLLAGLLVPATASAFYGDGATIVSADLGRLEQGDDASGSPATSGDGRYVAFQTRARNFFADDDPDPPGKYRVGGVFRRDMQSGAMERVADGDTFNESDNSIVFRGARSPSISADGRYIVFSTAQKLVTSDTNDNIDVYRRDMSLPAAANGAFVLVSAKDGASAPAAYAPRTPPLPGRNPGTEVWPGEAISADGTRVVFRSVEVDSDLPARPTADTPGYNLFVRDLAARTTQLVTRDRITAAPAGGAFGPAGISGDGTTVAWPGQNAPQQTRFLQGERVDPVVTYYLWRRVSEGPAALTRRLTGAVDLDDPACPANGAVGTDPTATGPCYGPLTDTEQSRNDISTKLPALSNDGYTAGFLVGAGPRPNSSTGTGLDAWVTDMHPGVSRKAGSRELTREGAPGEGSSGNQIESTAISGDGRWLALTTSRSRFVLGAIAPVGSFRAFPDARDLYVIDLAGRTVERATRAYDGSDDNGDAGPPTVSADGAAIAFSSSAGNLFFGDANERDDVFRVTRQPEPPSGGLPDAPPPTSTLDGPGSQADVAASDDEPFLRVSPKRQKDGRVVLVVNAPGAGSLDAVARAKFAVKAKKGSRRRRSVEKQVARARARATRPGRVQVVLIVARAYRAQVRSRKGLAATVKLTFKPSRGKVISATTHVTFLASKK